VGSKLSGFDLQIRSCWTSGDYLATLVTGLGYIGSALAKRLAAQGELIVAIESFFSTPRSELTPLLDQHPITLIEGSIVDQVTLDRAFEVEPIDTVFHLAAQSSARPDAASLAETQETNFTGQRMLLDTWARGVKRVVVASSMRLYRTPLPRVVTERSPVDPGDLVHLSQLYGEILLAEHRRRHTDENAFTGMAARLGIVHGVSPVMKSDERFLAAPQLFCLRAARGLPLSVATGPQTELAFVHVDDAVSGLIQCRDSSQLEPANVAAEVCSVASIAEAVQRVAAERGLEVAIDYQGRVIEIGERFVDSRLGSTGFRPTLRVADSIGQVLDHYLKSQKAA